jgi:hypothetical protein
MWRSPFAHIAALHSSSCIFRVRAAITQAFHVLTMRRAGFGAGALQTRGGLSGLMSGKMRGRGLERGGAGVYSEPGFSRAAGVRNIGHSCEIPGTE